MRYRSMPEVASEPYGYSKREMWPKFVDKYFVQVKGEIGADNVSYALTKLMADLEVDIPPALPDAYSILFYNIDFKDDQRGSYQRVQRRCTRRTPNIL